MFFLFIYWLSWPKSTTMCILNRLWRYLTTLVVVLNCFDIPTDFNEIAERIFKSLLKSGLINEDVTRYLPGMCRLRFQGLIKKKKKKNDNSTSWKYKQGISQQWNGNSKNMCEFNWQNQKIYLNRSGAKLHME